MIDKTTEQQIALLRAEVDHHKARAVEAYRVIGDLRLQLNALAKENHELRTDLGYIECERLNREG